MLTPLNRRELITVFHMDQCQRVREALDKAGIQHQVKARSRVSPSVFNMGVREHTGMAFQSQDNQYQYVIYVKRSDWDHARHVMG